MALTNIPVIWSSQVLAALRAAIVYGAASITNRNYQGEITEHGDRVRVTGLVDPTIFDVASNADIPVPETLTDNQQELVIDTSKGFNFQVDDLDQLQNAVGSGLLLRSAQNAALKLAEVADGLIAAKMVAGAVAGNAVGTDAAPILVNAPMAGGTMPAGQVDVYRVLTLLSVKLDKAKVPRQGRWVVLPPFMEGAMANDSRFSQLNNGDILLNGRLGRGAGFDIYASPNVPLAVGKYKVVAGSPLATSYAEQLVETVFYRPERRFADASKGRHVYGSKVFYPAALAVATVSDSSGIDA